MALSVDFDDRVITIKTDAVNYHPLYGWLGFPPKWGQDIGDGTSPQVQVLNRVPSTRFVDQSRQGEPPMPIYEYCCEDCNKSFEKLVFGAEAPNCPSCDSKKVTRLMSSCGFVSKGGAGETTRASASASSCGGCAATSCATCGH